MKLTDLPIGVKYYAYCRVCKNWTTIIRWHAEYTDSLCEHEMWDEDVIPIGQIVRGTA